MNDEVVGWADLIEHQTRVRLSLSPLIWTVLPDSDISYYVLPALTSFCRVSGIIMKSLGNAGKWENASRCQSPTAIGSLSQVQQPCLNYE